MKSLLLHLCSLLVMAMVTCFSLAVASRLPSELLNYIPAVPNAVAVVDAAELFQSPLAKQNRGPPPLATRTGLRRC